MRFVTNNHVLGFYGFTWVSQVMSAIIASERCFCILQPLRSQTVLRTSTMTAVIAAVYVVVVGLYFLVTTRYHLVCARDPQSGKDFWTFVSGQFYLDNQKLIDSLDAFVYGVGLPCVMIAVVMTTTTITAVKLRQVVEWRAGASSVSSSSGVSQREIALTRMLVYNSCFFIVCVCPIALFRSVQVEVVLGFFGVFFGTLYCPSGNFSHGKSGRYTCLAFTVFRLRLGVKKPN